MTAPRSFLDALVSSQRAPELVDADDIFGFLIGSWNIEAVLHDPDGRMQRSKRRDSRFVGAGGPRNPGFIHFSPPCGPSFRRPSSRRPIRHYDQNL
jgi:hypothetical protein